MGFDLAPFLGSIARREVQIGADPLEAARRLSEGAPLRMYAPQGARAEGDQVIWVHEASQANVTLVIHQGQAGMTAHEVEVRMNEGQRVALLDRKYAGRGDPQLLHALLDSTVYLSSLAAYDTDLMRVLAALLTPMRDGAAFREYLAQSLLYQCAWQGLVRAEIERRFGQAVRDERRASDQARARLGATLVRMGRRGLRFEVRQLGFHDGRLDGFWFRLS